MIIIAPNSIVNIDALLDLVITKLLHTTETQSSINYKQISNREKNGKRKFLKFLKSELGGLIKGDKKQKKLLRLGCRP